jgi:acetyl esterase/lipase
VLASQGTFHAPPIPLSLTLVLAILAANAAAQPSAKQVATDTFTHKEDVIYARKHGTALTLDVFAPKEKAIGRGVILCVSGGWVSDKKMLATYRPVFVPPLLARGYTVFAVLHRSQPPFTNLDAAEDIEDAVKFVKKHAGEYGVDPARLGVAEMSAGGHLALLQGTATGDGRVAAVGCFCPPTDFLNYGKDGVSATGEGLKLVAAAFDYHRFAAGKNVHFPVTGEERVALVKRVSPAYRVSKESAPALILHGDADWLVPIQQSELIVARYKDAGVPFELVVRKGQGHGWPKMSEDVKLIADWFDKHLSVAR